MKHSFHLFNGLLLLLTSLLSTAQGQETTRLRENLPPGSQYHVSSRVDLSGTLTAPATVTQPGSGKPIPVSGESAVEYDERVLELNAQGQVQKTLRIYGRLDFRRKVSEQVQQSGLRPAVRRLVLMRLKESEVPFSPDGPLTWGEIDQVRTDVFTPALLDLLPVKEVRVGDQWPASQAAVRELTDLDELKEGQLTCQLHEIASRTGRRFAQVNLKGTVTGVNEDGPNRQHLEGYFFFDLQSNHLSYLYINGISWLLDPDGKTLGRVEGKYVLTRRLEPKIAGLSDADLHGVELQANDENTLLLFQEPALGVEFVYPRRWTVHRADARQIDLKEPRGGGLLITLEPLTQTPTGPQFQAEVNQRLLKEAGRVLRTAPLQRLRGAPEELDHFALEAELGKAKLVLDHYVARQAAGGATFAGRFPTVEAPALQKDAERIARSLKLVPPKK